MQDLKIQPLENRVVIEPSKAEEKTPSGIFIPDAAKKKPQEGIVIAVGKGTKDEPMTLKIGDKVLYSEYAGTSYHDKKNNQEYLIIKQSEILAILG